jgi:hypothetical protein
MTSFPKKPESPNAAEVELAKKWPDSEVYRIRGQFGSEEEAPCEAIIGAWKVNGEGKIIGDFISNPNFDPKFKKPNAAAV